MTVYHRGTDGFLDEVSGHISASGLPHCGLFRMFRGCSRESQKSDKFQTLGFFQRHMSCSMWQLLGWSQVCADYNEPHRRLMIYFC